MCSFKAWNRHSGKHSLKQASVPRNKKARDSGENVLPSGSQVLEEAQADLINYKGTGMSVMEMSHRGKEFMGIAAKAEEDLRKLLQIPANYKVMFLQGGWMCLCDWVV